MQGQINARLRKVIELWRGTDKEGERQAARSRGEAMSKAAGLTFEEAVRAVIRETSGGNVFAGFDDIQEAKEPGWKAQRAAERQAKQAARLRRQEALKARYGFLEAALEPCERERALIAALARWRVPCNPPYERWTRRIGTVSDYWERPSPEIAAAIASAYPIPTTIPEAKAEHDYWEARERDMRDAKPEQDIGDYALDLTAGLRAEMVRDLLEKIIPARDLNDVVIRFAHYRSLENHEDAIEERLFKDVEALATCATVTREPDPSTEHKRHRGPAPHQAIVDALRADPSRSDRSIARELGVSPTTVGKVRSSHGLASSERSVRRAGQMYGGAFNRPRRECGDHANSSICSTLRQPHRGDAR